MLSLVHRMLFTPRRMAPIPVASFMLVNCPSDRITDSAGGIGEGPAERPCNFGVDTDVPADLANRVRD